MGQKVDSKFDRRKLFQSAESRARFHVPVCLANASVPRERRGSVVRHFQLEIADHLEMLAIPRRKLEAFLQRCGGDQRIQRAEPGRLGMRLHQIVRAPRDALVRRDLFVCRYQDVEVDHLTLALGAGD